MSLIIKNNPNNSIETIRTGRNDSSRWAMDKIKKRYVVREKIGQGCFGSVRRVKNKHTKEYYGCKTIPKSLIDDMNVLKEEVSNLDCVRDHPHIVRFEEVFEDKKELHIITELLEGGELYDLVYSMKLSGRYFKDDDSAHMIRNILDGLAYCHDVAGIVHRDLKASNFMFRKSPTKLKTKTNKKGSSRSSRSSSSNPIGGIGNDTEIDSSVVRDIKIIDFGLSMKIPSSGLISGCLGTPYYVAPEVVTDDYYTNACDVWSVGVIAYLILSLTLPYQGGNEQKTVHMIMDAEKYPPSYSSMRWAEVEPEAIDFCKKLMQKDPKKRPSMREALNHPWIVKHCGRHRLQQEPQTLQEQEYPLVHIPLSPLSPSHNIAQKGNHFDDDDDSDHNDNENEAPPSLLPLSLCSSHSFDSERTCSTATTAATTYHRRCSSFSNHHSPSSSSTSTSSIFYESQSISNGGAIMEPIPETTKSKNIATNHSHGSSTNNTCRRRQQQQRRRRLHGGRNSNNKKSGNILQKMFFGFGGFGGGQGSKTQ